MAKYVLQKGDRQKMSPISTLLQKRITQLCTEKKMSYYTLSINSSVPFSTIKNIIDGNTKNPGIVTIMKLCGGLGISITDFFDTKEFIELSEEITFWTE